MGRETFERVIANPESLADMDVDEESAFFEGFQYIPTEVYEEKTGEMPKRTKPGPESPAGKQWNEDAVAEVFPRLAQKHGFE
jgi:hypothetical protein